MEKATRPETSQEPVDAAERGGMVTLHSVRRILAVDLGLDAEAIEHYLAGTVTSGPGAGEIPLAEALRIVATAEAGVVRAA